MEKNILPEDVDVSSELAERVLTEISERKGKLMKREFLTSASQGGQTGMKLHKRRSQIPLYSLVAAILCILILAGGFLMASIFGHHSSNTRKAIPARLAWELQQGQLLAQTQEGVFGIQYVDITSREIRIFYAFHLNKASSVGVEAFSALPSTPKDLTKLAATTQSFGEVGTFTVGVIHIPRQNRVGQTLKLQMSVIGKNSPIWQLLPLHQLRSDPNPTALLALSPRQAPFSEVIWYGPVTEHQVAFFKSTATHQHGSDAYVFLRLDNPVTITSITRMEYLALAGSKNIL